MRMGENTKTNCALTTKRVEPDMYENSASVKAGEEAEDVL